MAIHPFENAGLGKAPFKYVGMAFQDIMYGQAVIDREAGITTAPGGSCAYCGQYIINMFNVQSADGRKFHVGSDCIAKVAKESDIQDVDIIADRVRRELRAMAKRRVAVRAEAAKAWFLTAECQAHIETLGNRKGFLLFVVPRAGNARVVKEINALRAALGLEKL